MNEPTVKKSFTVQEARALLLKYEWHTIGDDSWAHESSDVQERVAAFLRDHPQPEAPSAEPTNKVPAKCCFTCEHRAAAVLNRVCGAKKKINKEHLIYGCKKWTPIKEADDGS